MTTNPFKIRRDLEAITALKEERGVLDTIAQIIDEIPRIPSPPGDCGPVQWQCAALYDASPGKGDLASVGHVPVAWPGEEKDAYPVVATLNGRWRVIACKNSIQWILQNRRSGPDSWRGRSFCRTSEALVRCARQHAGPIDPHAMAVLLRLPERIGERQP